MTRRMSFAKSPRSVGAARRFTRSALLGLPPEALEVVELMVSELTTNCIRHSKTAFDVVINRCADEVRVEVSDHAGGRPTVRSPGPEDPTGPRAEDRRDALGSVGGRLRIGSRQDGVVRPWRGGAVGQPEELRAEHKSERRSVGL